MTWAMVGVGIQARMLLEDPSSVSQILESWDSIWPPKLEEWGSDAAILRGFYEGYRTGMFLGNKVQSAS